MHSLDGSGSGFYQLSLVGLLVVVSIATLLYIRKWRSIPRRLPPGPLSLPFIGHLHLLEPLRPHHSLYRLSQSYGPLMYLHLGSVPLLVASSSSTAREILQSHDVVFASRPRSSVGDYMFFGGKGIAFSPYGTYWRSLKGLCDSFLFSSEGHQAWKAARAAEVSILMQSVFEDSLGGKEVMVLSKLECAFINVIVRQLFGQRCTELSTLGPNPLQNIVALMAEMFVLLGAFNIGDFFPCLQWIDLQGYTNRVKVTAAKFQSLLDKIIGARRKLRKGEPSSRKDLLDVLLSASQDSQRNVPVTDDDMKAIFEEMLLAGTQTSALTVEWVLAEMLNSPRVMKKLQEELDVVVGTERLVQESDVEQLPYLQAVVKETLRLHPCGPLLLPRESMRPCRVAGYDIPEKTLVYVNVWAISKDANEWERPWNFIPERFMKSNLDVSRSRFDFLPFGGGRRMCPGWLVGLRNVQLMVASLVQGFDWSVASAEGSVNGEPIDMSERFVYALKMANPLVARATPRLSSNIYSSLIH